MSDECKLGLASRERKDRKGGSSGSVSRDLCVLSRQASGHGGPFATRQRDEYIAAKLRHTLVVYLINHS
jgi:hypothetical protein